MTDIVDRLRNHVVTDHDATVAADEIERLRAALRPFAAAFHSDDPAGEITLHHLRMANEALEEKHD